jgi:glutamate 5-kinase
MDSKLKAVQNAAKAGAHVVIANAATPRVLQSIFAGRDVGTFVPGCAL